MTSQGTWRSVTCAFVPNQKCISNQNIEPRWVAEGYSNWKEATRKGRGFKGHEASDCHIEAVERTIVLPSTTDDIGETLSSEHSAEKSVARQALMKILSNVKFLARQALPLRGKGASEVNSNFNQLYTLQAEDNQFLLDWMNKTGDKWTTKDPQNELMKIMALGVLRDIASEIKGADFFTIMADEATDSANKTQLTLNIRWVDDDLYCHEDTIKTVLIRMTLNLRSCRGQNYDGCATMKGSKNGVASQIKSLEPRALLTHCYTYSLNMVVGDAIKGKQGSKECSRDHVRNNKTHQEITEERF